MNQEKAAFFDGQADAPWAAAEYGEDERPKIARLIREAELGPGQRVLEPGCGSGRLSRVLAEAVGPTGLVAALDISDAMVGACRDRVAGLAQVVVSRAALEELDHPAGSFDRVICHQVFPHFDDQPLALKMIHRLLRPDSLLEVVHFIRQEEVNDTHRKAGTVVETDMLPEPEEMRRMVQAAGFGVEMLTDDELGYFLRARKR